MLFWTRNNNILLYNTFVMSNSRKRKTTLDDVVDDLSKVTLDKRKHNDVVDKF